MRASALLPTYRPRCLTRLKSFATVLGKVRLQRVCGHHTRGLPSLGVAGKLHFQFQERAGGQWLNHAMLRNLGSTVFIESKRSVMWAENSLLLWTCGAAPHQVQGGGDQGPAARGTGVR